MLAFRSVLTYPQLGWGKEGQFNLNFFEYRNNMDQQIKGQPAVGCQKPTQTEKSNCKSRIGSIQEKNNSILLSLAQQIEQVKKKSIAELDTLFRQSISQLQGHNRDNLTTIKLLSQQNQRAINLLDNQRRAKIQLSKQLNQLKVTSYQRQDYQENRIRSLQQQISKQTKQRIALQSKVFSQKEGHQYDCTILVQKGQQQHKKKQTVSGKVGLKFGFMGRVNVGKTFVVNKLLESRFEQAFSKHTRGICIKYPINKETVCYLDTEGIFKPQKQMRSMVKVQDVIQFYLMEVCDILCFVVSGIISTEQERIEVMKKRLSYQQCDRPKKLIVLHNYFDFTEVKQVWQHFNQNILCNFTLKEQTFKCSSLRHHQLLNNIYYVQSQYVKNVVVFHLVLAKEGSPAGDFFNESAFNFLQNQSIFYFYHTQYNPPESFKIFLQNYHERELKDERTYSCKEIQCENSLHRTHVISCNKQANKNAQIQGGPTCKPPPKTGLDPCLFRHKLIEGQNKVRVQFSFPHRVLHLSAQYISKESRGGFTADLEVLIRIRALVNELEQNFQLSCPLKISSNYRVELVSQQFLQVKSLKEETVTEVDLVEGSKYEEPSDQQLKKQATHYGNYLLQIPLNKKKAKR